MQMKRYINYVKWDHMRDRKRTNREMLYNAVMYPIWIFLGRLAKAGFLNTEHGALLRLRDFTPFFWRVLVRRAVERERAYWEREMSIYFGQQLEKARAEGGKAAFDFLLNRIDEDFKSKGA